MGYLLRAVIIPLWWVAMWFSPSVYSYFAFPGTPPGELFVFVVPDVFGISLLSFVVWLRPNRILKAMVLGGFTYGTLWCATKSMTAGGGYLSTAAMMLGCVFNVWLLLEDRVFRRRGTGTPSVNVLKTLLQSAVIWGVTLVLMPLAILHASGTWPPVVAPGAMMIVGLVLFALCSVLGVYTGLVMALRGEGTPLPTDAASRLVTSGPYGFVRNPMAMAGLGQGMGVALFFGSWEIAVYCVVGMAVWNYLVRPWEERDLARVFGSEYDAYRGAVRCWVPRTRRYMAVEACSSGRPIPAGR